MKGPLDPCKIHGLGEKQSMCSMKKNDRKLNVKFCSHKGKKEQKCIFFTEAKFLWANFDFVTSQNCSLYETY